MVLDCIPIKQQIEYNLRKNSDILQFLEDMKTDNHYDINDIYSNEIYKSILQKSELM